MNSLYGIICLCESEHWSALQAQLCQDLSVEARGWRSRLLAQESSQVCLPWHDSALLTEACQTLECAAWGKYSFSVGATSGCIGEACLARAVRSRGGQHHLQEVHHVDEEEGLAQTVLTTGILEQLWDEDVVDERSEKEKMTKILQRHHGTQAARQTSLFKEAPVASGLGMASSSTSSASTRAPGEGVAVARAVAVPKRVLAFKGSVTPAEVRAWLPSVQGCNISIDVCSGKSSTPPACLHTLTVPLLVLVQARETSQRPCSVLSLGLGGLIRRPQASLAHTTSVWGLVAF